MTNQNNFYGPKKCVLLKLTFIYCFMLVFDGFFQFFMVFFPVFKFSSFSSVLTKNHPIFSKIILFHRCNHPYGMQIIPSKISTWQLCTGKQVKGEVFSEAQRSSNKRLKNEGSHSLTGVWLQGMRIKILKINSTS